MPSPSFTLSVLFSSIITWSFEGKQQAERAGPTSDGHLTFLRLHQSVSLPISCWSAKWPVDLCAHPSIVCPTTLLILAPADGRQGHVFGRSTRKEQCYDNLRISKNAWDTNLVKVQAPLATWWWVFVDEGWGQANPEYIAVNWEAGGGGAFAVIPTTERGRLPARIPLFVGHTAVVLDTDW